MIGSLGGAEIDKSGARNYPGSGGMIGGLSMPGAGWAYWSGAGLQYSRFTPGDVSFSPGQFEPENNIPSPTTQRTPYPGEEPNPYPYPDEVPPYETPFPTGNVPIITGGGTTTTGGGETTPGGGTNQPPILNCLWGDCDNPTNIPTQVPWNIFDQIKQFLSASPRTQVESTPPIFSFNPMQTSGGGIGTMQILAIVAFGALAWFLYKKYA